MSWRVITWKAGEDCGDIGPQLLAEDGFFLMAESGDDILLED